MKLFCLETGLDSRQPLFLLFPPISRFKSLTHQKCCLCTCSRWKMSRRCSSPRLFKNWLMVMSSRAAEKKWCQQGFHKFWLVVQRAFTHLLLLSCRSQSLHLRDRWPRPPWCHSEERPGCLCCWPPTGTKGKETERWPHPLSLLCSPHWHLPKSKKEKVCFDLVRLSRNFL